MIGAEGHAAGGAYSHVQSRFAQAAAKYTEQSAAKVKERQQQKSATVKVTKPDRFAESARTSSMVALIADRW
jgi:hypothetical protein